MSPDELAAGWREAWAGGGFAAVCTADVGYEDPLAVTPLDGVDALEGHAARLREAFPDIAVEAVGEPLAGDGHACLPWRAKGTHRGQVGGLPPTNRFVVVHGVHYVELRDGLVRRGRGFFDLYDAAVQLGLLPQRGGLGEAALLLVRGFGLRAGG